MLEAVLVPARRTTAVVLVLLAALLAATFVAAVSASASTGVSRAMLPDAGVGGTSGGCCPGHPEGPRP